MKRIALGLAAAGILLAGCSNSDADSGSGADQSATSTTPSTAESAYPLSGLQDYDSVQAIADELVAGGVACTGMALDDSSMFAVQQGRCATSGTDQIVIGIFSSDTQRAQAESVLEELAGMGIGYGYVEGGNWLINCGGTDLCIDVKGVVGGRLVAVEADA